MPEKKKETKKEANQKETKKGSKDAHPIGKAEKRPLNPQELLMKHSFLKSQLEQSLQEMSNLQMIKADHLSAKATLTNLKDLSPDNESLIPSGANTFLMAKVADKDKVLVDVGSNVVMKKSTAEAISRIDSLVEELNAREKELAGNIQFCQTEIEHITPQLQALQRK